MIGDGKYEFHEDENLTGIYRCIWSRSMVMYEMGRERPHSMVDC